MFLYLILDSSPDAKCLYPVVKPPAAETDNTSLTNSSTPANDATVIIYSHVTNTHNDCDTAIAPSKPLIDSVHVYHE